jgi:3-oxoacid CoA-transferase B subunit
MKAALNKETIALRVAREFFDGAVVNLGGGIPTLACNLVPEGVTVIFHSENGMAGYGSIAYEEDEIDVTQMNASGQFVKSKPGMNFFDHATSFVMIRGGRIDISVLGAFQVSEKGDLANWRLPDRKVGAIGGGMDLAFCAKKLIVSMTHTAPGGEPKIVKKLTYPVTAPNCVKLIVTDLAVIEVTKDGLLLKETAPGWSVEEIQAVTEAKLTPAKDLKEMTL